MSNESEGRPVTLEMIEKHLKKQDTTARQSQTIQLISFSGAIIVAGSTILIKEPHDPSLFLAGICVLIIFLLFLCWYSKHQPK